MLRLQPDERVVRLIREGHDAAFEEIVRRYRERLVGFAATIVPTARAEDVVQESLAKAYVAIGSTTTDLKLRAWLFTIVRNTALNSLRDEPPLVELDESLAGRAQPPDVAERHARLAELIAGLEALPESQRRALVMRELEGRGHAEIATELGATQGAVRQLIFRARLGLREGMGLLIPLPLIRMMLEAGPVKAGIAGGGLAGGAALGAGAAGGVGGGVGFKAGAVLVAAVLAVGTEMALDGDTALESSRGSEQRTDRAGAGSPSPDASASGVSEGRLAPTGRGEGGVPGDGGEGGDDDSGPGGDEDDGGDSSGPGSGDDGGGDSSGPGSGDDDEPEGDDSSGPGSGGSDDEPEVDDSSGPGSGGSDDEPDGDDSSGSGSGGSGSSGSGSGDEPDEPDHD